jgi:hypothetical protein
MNMPDYWMNPVLRMVLFIHAFLLNDPYCFHVIKVVSIYDKWQQGIIAAKKIDI